MKPLPKTVAEGIDFAFAEIERNTNDLHKIYAWLTREISDWESLGYDVQEYKIKSDYYREELVVKNQR